MTASVKLFDFSRKKQLTKGFKCAKLRFAVQVAGIAQSVEQLIRNQQVVCSSHITSSMKNPCILNEYRDFCFVFI